MAAKLHRKELKHDEIREKLTDAARSVRLHTRELVYIIVIVLAVGLCAFLWYRFETGQQQESQKLLGAALEKLQAEISDPSNPSTNSQDSGSLRYSNEAEKYASALKDLEQIIQKYGNTPAAEIARYHAGICAFYLKDYKKAENYLKTSSRVSEKNVLYFLSRVGLANLYTATGKYDLAIQMLQEAIDRNENTVPEESLLMQLADTCRKSGKTKEAIQTYEKITKEYKESPVNWQAQNSLDELRGKQ